MTKTAAESVKTQNSAETQNIQNIASLRQRAEEKFNQIEAVPQPTSPLEIELILHELRVHQIELEIQNEEMRRVQVELDTERAAYFEQYDMAPVGYLTLSETGLIKRTNLAATTMLGVNRNVLLHMSISHFIFSEDQKVYYLQRKLLNVNGQSQGFEIRLLHANGSLFWAHLQVALTLDGECWITFNDITESKQAHDKLRRSEQKFLAIIEASPVPLALNDEQGNIIFLNKAFVQTVGYTTNEIPTLSDWWPRAYPDMQYRQWVLENWQINLEQAKLTNTQFAPMELDIVCKDLSVRTFVCSAAKLEENFAGIHLVVLYDISSRKKSEAVSEARLRLMQFAGSQTLDELLRATIDEAEALTGSQVGFYHFLAPDQVNLSLQAWSTNTARQMCRVEGDQRHYPLRVAGVWAEAIRSRMGIIHNDCASLPNRKGLPEGHAPIIRELVVPIVRGDKVVVLLGVGNKPTEYDQSDVVTVTSLADLTWDTVEQKLAEAELQKSEERHRTTIHTAMDGFWLVNTQGRILEVNDAYCKMSGYSQQELLSMSIWELDANETANGVVAHMQRIMELDNVRFETRHRRKDGSLIDVEICVQYKPFQNGFCVAFFRDITERKLAESRMRKLAQAVEQSPVSVVITDTDGIIEFVNPAFTKVSGYTAEEAIGLLPRALKSGLTPPETYKNLWATITSDKTWYGEFANKRKDGSIFYEHATISAIRNDRGEITHYLAAKVDVTDKKNIREQLIHSQKVESIGQLAGGLAHDLNNILTVVNGYATLAQQRREKDQTQVKYLDEIVKASLRASSLTHSLLAYSRKQEMNLQKQNLNSLITTVGSFIERIIHDNIEFTISLEEEPLGVYVDDSQIEQVLLNLASNARDAMPDGGTFSIKTAAGEMDEEYITTHGFGAVGRYAVITVTDSGHGMDPETKRKVFNPFFTTKDVGKGTGLGLAMVMGIIKQHGGFVDLQSEPGKGSVFKLYLPLLAEPVVIASEDVRDARMEGGSGTILLVEDDPPTLILLEELLKRAGYNVITAVDGEDAVKKFVAFDDEIMLVISDVVMPKKSGRQVMDEIRQLSGGMKFIFVSGHSSDVIDREGGFGADVEVIMKPVMPFDLLGKIREIIEPHAKA